VDPVDPDSDSDPGPEYWFLETVINIVESLKN
jgi:hypothetical protein